MLTIILSFQLEKYLLASLVFLFGKFFLSPFLKDSFAGWSILVYSFILSTFWIHYPILSWPAKFLLRNLIILWRFPCMWWATFFLLLSKFFLFGFWQFNYVSCGPFQVQTIWGLLGLVNLDIHFLPKFLIFLAIISLIDFPSFFSFSSPYTIPILCVLLPFRHPIRHFTFLFIFLFFCFSD